jgi:NADH-quinone oxidoreductase subunit M
VVPRLTAAFIIITLASIGMPGLNGFIGEFLIMLGAFRWDPRYIVVAGLGVILSSVYMLWMVQRVYYGKVTRAENAHLPDVTVREWAGLAPLCVMALVMGIVPTLFTKPMEPAVRRMVERVQPGEPVRVNNQIQNSKSKLQTARAGGLRGDIELVSQPGAAAR